MIVKFKARYPLLWQNGLLNDDKVVLELTSTLRDVPNEGGSSSLPCARMADCVDLLMHHFCATEHDESDRCKTCAASPSGGQGDSKEHWESGVHTDCAINQGSSSADVAIAPTEASPSAAYATMTPAWEGVVGMEAVKQELEDAVWLPVQFPHLFLPGKQHCRRAPNKVLLYGEPGTGKSNLARACAQVLHARLGHQHPATNGSSALPQLGATTGSSALTQPGVTTGSSALPQLGATASSSALPQSPPLTATGGSAVREGGSPANSQPRCGDSQMPRFFPVQLSEVLSPWLGESEKQLRKVFEAAREAAPSIIFMDELDSLARARAAREDETSRRLKNTLLVLMDDLNDAPGVVLIAATNRPKEIDSAIMRRFEKRIHVPLPNEEDRRALIAFYTKDMCHALSEEDIRELAESTFGVQRWSAADLRQCIQDCAMEKVRELAKASCLVPLRGTMSGDEELAGNDDDDEAGQSNSQPQHHDDAVVSPLDSYHACRCNDEEEEDLVPCCNPTHRHRRVLYTAQARLECVTSPRVPMLQRVPRVLTKSCIEQMSKRMVVLDKSRDKHEAQLG